MRSVAILLVMLATGTALAHRVPAPPDDPLERGRRAYRLGDYDTALQQWTMAYQLLGNAEILYNIGQAWLMKGDRERARFFFDSYLHAKPDAPNRAEVEAKIAELTPATQPASQPAPPPSEAAPRPPRRHVLVEVAFGIAFPEGDYDKSSVHASPAPALEVVWFPIRPLGVLARSRYVPEITRGGYTAHHLDGELGLRGELAVGAGFALHAEAALIYASEHITSNVVTGSAAGWGGVVRAGATRAFGRVVLGIDVGYQSATISSAAFAGNTQAAWIIADASVGVAF
jgi:hypothetical protein